MQDFLNWAGSVLFAFAVAAVLIGAVATVGYRVGWFRPPPIRRSPHHGV